MIMLTLKNLVVLVCLLCGVAKAHQDDVIEDFSRLMHESSDDLLSQLSKPEVKKSLKLILEDIDEDDDGLIEEDEIIKWVAETEREVTQAEAEAEIDSLDSDGDDNVSWEEYAAGNTDDDEQEMKFAKKLFDLCDEDDDGELNTEEYIKFSNPEDDDTLRPLLVKKVMKTLDGNGDGKLSYNELKDIAKSPKVFDEDDENDDGFLDEEEIDEILDDDFEKEELDDLLEHLSSADDNSDGKLTIEELAEEEHLFKDTPIFTLGLKMLKLFGKDGKDEL